MRPTRSQRMRLSPRRAAGLRRAAGRRFCRDVVFREAALRVVVELLAGRARAAIPGPTRPSPAFLHLLPGLGEGLQAGKSSRGAKLLLDPQQAVVLGNAIGSRWGAGLDLAGASGDGKVGDRRVLGLARAV